VSDEQAAAESSERGVGRRVAPPTATKYPHSTGSMTTVCQPICAESAVKPQANKQTNMVSTSRQKKAQKPPLPCS